jgi:hypothetical protein
MGNGRRRRNRKRRGGEPAVVRTWGRDIGGPHKIEAQLDILAGVEC